MAFKEIKRIVELEDGSKLTLHLDTRGVRIKPYRAKSGEVFVTWSKIYQRQVWDEARANQPVRKRRSVRRGLL